MSDIELESFEHDLDTIYANIETLKAQLDLLLEAAKLVICAGPQTPYFWRCMEDLRQVIHKIEATDEENNKPVQV
jgi:hypothetical protein